MADLEELKRRYLQTKDPRNRKYFAEQIRLAGGTVPVEGAGAPANISTRRLQPSPSQDQSDNDDEDDDNGEDSSNQEPEFGEDADNVAGIEQPDTGTEQYIENLPKPENNPQPGDTPIPSPAIPGVPTPGTGPSRDIVPAPQAEQATDQDSDDQQDQTPSESAGDDPGGQREDLRDQAKKEVTDAAKKGIKNWLKKTFTKELLVSLLTNPYFWLVVAILIIIIVIIGVSIYFSSSANSGANGKTPGQITSALGDKSAIEKLAALSGSLGKDPANNVVSQILPALSALDTELGTNTVLDPGLKAEVKTDIKNAQDAANQCLQKTDQTACGADLVQKVTIVLAKLDNIIPPTDGSSPVQQADLFYPDPKDLDKNFNTNLHIGTPLHPEGKGEDNTTGHRTYIFTGQDKSDAVDIYTKSGAPVYSALKGKVVKITDDASGIDTKETALGGPTQEVVVQSDNGDYQILYAFIHPSVKLNDSVGKGAKIGTTSIDGTSVVHIELVYCGVPLLTSQIDKLDHDSKDSIPKHTTWGAYYWDHLKYVLKF